MPTNLPSFVLAYHGCDKSIAEEVLKNQEDLKPSTKDYHWLGSGIYFWENDPLRAYQWAKHMKRHDTASDIKNPYAIGAIIDPGSCLDLTNAQSIKIVEQTFKTLEEIAKDAGEEIPENEGSDDDDRDLINRYRDCFVINTLHALREGKGELKFDTVRAAFLSGKPIYKTSGFSNKAHTQICVREKKSIVGYFRILDSAVFK